MGHDELPSLQDSKALKKMKTAQCQVPGMPTQDFELAFRRLDIEHHHSIATQAWPELALGLVDSALGHSNLACENLAQSEECE